MHEVVIYDLGSKFTSILVKPVTIISRVLLPKIAREKNILLFKKTAFGSFLLMVFVVLIFNLLLPFIVKLFITETVNLMPLRLFSLAPLFLSMSSYIATNNIIALGYNKHILYSIIFTTTVYLSFTGYFYFSNTLDNILAFITISVASYFAEFLYRIIISNKIIKDANRYNIY